jgi:hypothetical protein
MAKREPPKVSPSLSQNGRRATQVGARTRLDEKKKTLGKAVSVKLKENGISADVHMTRKIVVVYISVRKDEEIVALIEKGEKF